MSEWKGERERERNSLEKIMDERRRFPNWKQEKVSLLSFACLKAEAELVNNAQETHTQI